MKYGYAIVHSIVIRIAKNGCRCAQITSFLAVFYETAGDICQIFWFRDDGNTDTEILVLRSSSKRFLDKAEQVVLRMEKQFSGLRRQHRAEHHQGNLLAVSNNFLWKGERRFSLSPDIARAIRAASAPPLAMIILFSSARDILHIAAAASR